MSLEDAARAAAKQADADTQAANTLAQAAAARTRKDIERGRRDNTDKMRRQSIKAVEMWFERLKIPVTEEHQIRVVSEEYHPALDTTRTYTKDGWEVYGDREYWLFRLAWEIDGRAYEAVSAQEFEVTEWSGMRPPLRVDERPEIHSLFSRPFRVYLSLAANPAVPWADVKRPANTLLEIGRALEEESSRVD